MGGIHSLESIPGLHKRLKIRALLQSAGTRTDDSLAEQADSFLLLHKKAGFFLFVASYKELVKTFMYPPNTKK